MGNSASTFIGNQTTICRKVQKSAANKLQSLSELIRRQQKDANIAKAVGAGMVLMGTAACLLTGGMSLGLMGIGATAGIAGGAGGMAVSWLESEEMRKRTAEVQRILDQLKEETQEVIAALRLKRKYTDVPDYDTLIQNKKKLACPKKCGRRARNAISVINRTLKVQWMATGLKPEEVGVHNINQFRLGLTFLGKVKAGEVKPVDALAAAGISLAFNIKDVLKNLMDLKYNVSEVADVVADMANVLCVTE